MRNANFFATLSLASSPQSSIQTKYVHKLSLRSCIRTDVCTYVRNFLAQTEFIQRYEHLLFHYYLFPSSIAKWKWGGYQSVVLHAYVRPIYLSIRVLQMISFSYWPRVNSRYAQHPSFFLFFIYVQAAVLSSHSINYHHSLVGWRLAFDLLSTC